MIIFRSSKKSDIKNIMILDSECFGSEGEDNLYSEDFWEYLLGQFNCIVACDTSSNTNGIVGIISAIDEDSEPTEATIKLIKKYKIEKCYLIATLCVSKNYRSTGIGSELIKQIIKNVKNTNKDVNKYIILNVRESNSTAIKFYKKNGFKISEFVDIDYYSNPKENGLIMYLDANKKT